MLWNVIGVIASVVVILLLFELLELPDWIKASLRGTRTRKALEKKIGELDARVAELERRAKGS